VDAGDVEDIGTHNHHLTRIILYRPLWPPEKHLPHPPTHTPTQVLTLVQNGVLAEFEARYERLLEPLLLAMRFHAYPPTVRR